MSARAHGHTQRGPAVSVLLAALSLGPRDAYAEGGSVASDREALVALYHATDGPNWTNSTNWLSDAPLGEWYGVTTGADGRVTRVLLQGNGLSGELPLALGSLTNLYWLDLGQNELTGEIPRRTGQRLVNLDSLFLGGNGLTGEIPRELGNLTNLVWLDLWQNELTGVIPPELGNLTYLDRLDLRENRLTGVIPHELGRLAHLGVAGPRG